MGFTVKRSGEVPTHVWDAKASKELGNLVVALIKDRVNNGMTDTDTPFKPYSTTPITIAFDSDTGNRLKPKGGKPAYGSEKRADGSATMGPAFIFRAAGRTGNTGRKTRGAIIGRHYEGGYKEYKLLSRRGLTNKNGATGTEVDLTLSGRMLRSFRVIRHDARSVVVGLTGDAREYGQFTNIKRPWIGVSPANAREIDAALPAMIEGAERRGGRNGPR